MHDVITKEPLRPPWRLPLVIALWLLIFVLSVTQYAASSLLRGDALDLTAIVAWSSGWLVWIFLTAPVTRLSQRFPIERSSLGSRLPIHFVASIVASAFVILVEAVLVMFADGAAVGLGTILANMRRVVFYRFHVYVLVYWAVVAAAHALALYGQARVREVRAAELERELVEARLARLRGQLHPHFLFNTLNSVQAMLLTDEPQGATKMISRLSDLLRMSLEEESSSTHTLRRELEMLEIYLEIQKVRFQDRLKTSVDAEEGALAAEVPTFILQPIVENCIEHAISVDSSARSIEIKARREGEELVVVVDDDGPGFAANARDGMGLTITRRRLHTHFGEHARFAIASRDTKGTTVSIAIPWLTRRYA